MIDRVQVNLRKLCVKNLMKESDINITRYCINAGKIVMSKETVLTESQFFNRTKSNSIELFIASISSVIVFTVSTVSTAW